MPSRTLRVRSARGAANADQITDFSVTDDAIRRDNAIFTALTSTSVLFPTAFATGTAAGDADDRMFYNSACGVLYYGADGAGGIVQVQFATPSRA
jgi:Ca2+-binding RTX toxin-like protein